MDDATWKVIAMLMLVCLLLLLCNLKGRRLITPAALTFTHTLIKFVVCLLTYVFDTLKALFSAAQHLPIAWYAMAALTVLPVCNLITQSAAVLYLAVYCVTGLYICASTPVATKPPPAVHLGAKFAMDRHPPLGANFLSELRITSVCN